MRRASFLVALCVASSVGCHERAVDLGFWFEHVEFSSPSIGGAITSDDRDVIESTARAELTAAFAQLPITLSRRDDARYRVRVVQQLQDPRFRRVVGNAGHSWAISWVGGSGEVSFSFLASGAIAYAPPHAGRDDIVLAIGRAIGRTAVHEFTHQFLPTTSIHDSTDVRSYEHASAVRPEHYYGREEWGLAWPLLQKRFGRRGDE